MRDGRASDGTSLLRVSHGQNGCGTVNDVAYSPDNSLVATINGCTLKLWSVVDGTLIRTIGIGGGANASFSSVAIAFSPDGQIVASSIAVAYHSGAVSLWRVSDGSLIRTNSDAGGNALAFSPDSQILAAVHLSTRSLALWRVSDGTLIRDIAPASVVVAFSPDGSLIATAGLAGGEFTGDSTIELYRVSDGALVKQIKRTGGVSSVAFTPDGQALISVGYDTNQDAVNGYVNSTGEIRIWRLSDGVLLKTYDQLTGTGVFDVAISPDGKYFTYGSGKTMVLARVPDTSPS